MDIQMRKTSRPIKTPKEKRYLQTIHIKARYQESLTNFFGKIRRPTVLRGDSGGVELGELATVTAPSLEMSLADEP